MANVPARAVDAAGTLPLILIVAATARCFGIGSRGGLPWKLRREMQYFAHVTSRRYPPLSALGPAPPPGPAAAAVTAATASGDAAARTFNAVIMGRATWDSIPARFRPLRGRLNIVLSRSRTGLPTWTPGGEGGEEVPATELGPGGSVQAKSLGDALALLASLVRTEPAPTGDDAPMLGRIFVIGGASVYEQAIGLAQTRAILLTSIKTEFECDAFFPQIRVTGAERVGIATAPSEGSSEWQVRPQAELEQFVGRAAGEEKEGEVEYEYLLLHRVGH